MAKTPGLKKIITRGAVDLVSPFYFDLMSAICHKCINLAKDGTTKVGLDNLMQLVTPPSDGLDGAPRGTNARYYYAQMFADICKRPQVAPYILPMSQPAKAQQADLFPIGATFNLA